MTQQHFDEFIRGKLAALETEQDANGWDLFAPKLAAMETTAAAVSVDAFDQIFQDKLNNFSATEMDASWSLFEEKLIGEEAGIPTPGAEVLDEVIYNKLYNYQVPYEAATWKVLLRRLRKENWQWAEIAGYKLLELALILLLFGFGQWFISEPALQALPVNTETKTVIAQSDENIATEIVIGVAENSTDTESVNPKANNIIASIITTQSKQKVTKNKSIVLTTIIPAESVKASSAISKEEKASSPILEIDPTATKYDGEVVSNNTIALSDIELLETEINAVDVEEAYDLEDVTILSSTPKNKFRFGMYSVGMIDHITTPRDRVFNLEGYDRYSAGYGGGFSLSKQLLNNKWEIETGLVYISKQYPQQIVAHVFNGNVKDGYEVAWVSGIEMNIINIPLNLRYNVLGNNKWKVYGLGGGALQLILQANYDASSDALNSGIFGLSAAPSGQAKSSESERFQRKRFNNGFLADGNFETNRFYSYNVGIGLERFVSPRWSIFAQPTYQGMIHAFNSEGIGPNRDRINTMHILLGAKVGL